MLDCNKCLWASAEACRKCRQDTTELEKKEKKYADMYLIDERSKGVIVK